MNRQIIAALVVTLLTGCPPSPSDEDAGSDAGTDAPDASTSIGGVDPNRRLVELSAAEWASFCDWFASLPAQEVYYCEGETFRGTDDCSGCTLYDWTAAACRAGGPLYWSMQAPGCTSTVAMLAACNEEMAETVCWQAHPDTPACLALECPEP